MIPRVLRTTAFLALTGLAATACGPRRVVMNGREMTYEEGARRVFEEGRAAAERKDLRTAKVRYREVLDLFGASDRVPDALGGLAEILYEEGGCGAARGYMAQLDREHSGHPAHRRVFETLAACLDVAAARPPVSGFPEELDADRRRFEEAAGAAERRQVASEAAETALRRGEHVRAVRWLMRAREVAVDGPGRRAIEDEITEVIDQKVSFLGVRTLLEELGDSGFPRELLTYKLGRIQYHVHDHRGARETLNRYLQTWPAGAFVEGARGLLDRLDRLSLVATRKVGVLLPLSGKHRSYGELALNAIQLGMGLDRNNRGAAGLEVVVRDTRSDPLEAVRVTEQLILEDRVLVVLGPIFKDASVRAALTAQRFATPILTISTADELAQAGPFVFRNALTNEDQMKALVAYAMDVKGMKYFAVLHPRHPYGEELLHLFWDEVSKRRGEIRGVESYAVGDTTFTTQVKRLVARDALELRADFQRAKQECDKQPDTYRQDRCREQVVKNIKPIVDFDGLFIPDYPKTISMLSAALAFEDVIVEHDPRRLRVIERTLNRKVTPVTLLGANGWNSNDLTSRAGRNVENAIFTDGFFPGADNRDVSRFVRAYRRRHRRTPRLYPEALFYDSARIIAHILRERAPADREIFRVALRSLRDFPGVTGRTSFAGSNVARRPVRILTIQDGDIRELEGPSPDSASR